MEKYLEVKQSLNGQGIFALKKFLKDEVVFEVKGELITCDEDDEMDERIRDNSLRFDEDCYLSPEGEMGDYLNHSCEPNTGVIKRSNKLFIIAIRDIEIGEEICFDYSTNLGADDVWRMQCLCGTEGCRKTVKKFKNLPKTLQEKYISLEIVPSYILKK